MQFEIKAMVPEDIERVMVVARSMYSEGVYQGYQLSEARTRMIMEELIVNDIVLTDGAYIDGVLGGVVVAEIITDLWADVNVVYDHAFYLMPEYRFGRVGLGLLKRLDEWAKANKADMTRISVYAGVDNARVASILDKIGYTRSGSLHVKEHTECVPA